MSEPPTMPKITPIISCKAGEKQKLQIPRSQVSALLATDKAPFFEVYVQVQFIIHDEKGNPIIEEKDGKKLFKTAIVSSNIINFVVGVIHP